jgi:hypothetical protein
MRRVRQIAGATGGLRIRKRMSIVHRNYGEQESCTCAGVEVSGGGARLPQWRQNDKLTEWRPAGGFDPWG